MPRTSKESQEEDEGRENDAPRVDELEPDDRAQSKLDDEERDDEDDEDVDEDDVVEEIDLDDLSAMEGPDA